MTFGRFSSLLVLVCCGLAAQAGDAFAQAETAAPQPTTPFELPGLVSATIAFATDYVYRGVSQTDEDVALQSSLDWGHDSGVYLGFWGSNVDFKDGSSQIELDVYGGFANEYAGVTYDVMVLGYIYPGADDALDQDFVEFSLAAGYDFEILSASAGVAISPDFYASSGVGTHITAGVGIPIPLDLLAKYNIAVDSNFGYQDISSGGSYVHWNVGLGAQLLGFGLDLRYFGNDIDSRANVDDDRAVFTFSRSF